MTAQPVEPDTLPTEPPAAAATPTADPTPTEPPKAADPAPAANPWENPDAAKAEIERLRKENGAARTNAKAAAAEEARKELAQQIGKALGFVKDEPVDPAKLTEQLTATQAQAKQAALELAVFKSTTDATVAAALLDSRSFLAKVADLDPTDTAAIAAAVGEAVTQNPALGKRAPAPNPAQGAGANGPASVAQLTQADVDRLARENKYAEIDKAREDGRLNDLLGIK
jgi:hypothetical protein